MVIPRSIRSCNTTTLSVLINILLISLLTWNLHTSSQRENLKVVKVAMLIQATGNYASWSIQLVESARKHFLNQPGYSVTYFVFSDRLNEIVKGSDIVGIGQEFLGWPLDTMKRYEIYLNNSHRFKDMDYLYQADADLQFIDSVGPEVLGDLVGAFHPGYFMRQRKNFPYENRTESCAQVKEHEGLFYAYGAIYGGKREHVLRMLNSISNCAEMDKQKQIIPRWHDESYLNNYFVRNPPSMVLSAAYCTPEGKGKSFFLSFVC